MLANGADNFAVHSFQTLRAFYGKLLKRLVNGQCIGNILSLKQ